ncbi:hypothetical protein LTR05_006536 [Lithohypha guttulata]|uniref:CobW/HypB/UreG nucleotide-binding domain-containing protein n=1 Tax=Lithohypha guttulata TaxID=1690604 RepID=A0AAN7SVV5_9EURO|nr:hypothetical protein LTR05_006536 [Lithohypha guttulata]
MAPIPVTIITGFLGSGKTTLILNLIPQLPKSYKLALLKNEYGDVAIDSQLASEASISGVRELLNGCICCNLVGQLGDALFELRNEVAPDRIIIETSGSAFPATLAMEINRVARENPGTFVLDGVVSVIDVENWKGKWELVDEMSFERCLDRVGDIDVQTAWVKSRKGVVDLGVIIGIDGALISQKQDALNEGPDGENSKTGHEHDHNGHGHAHYENHQDEVEVLSVILKGSEGAGIHLDDFEDLLMSAPKDEIYRIKGIIASTTPPPDSTGERKSNATTAIGIYILNWAFSRWTYTAMPSSTLSALDGSSAKLTFILARGESNKWRKKLEKGDLLHMEDRRQGELSVQKIG